MKQAAEEIGVSERQVRRLLRELRQRGDKAVIHKIRGCPSSRKLSPEAEQQAVKAAGSAGLARAEFVSSRSETFLRTHPSGAESKYG